MKLNFEVVEQIEADKHPNLVHFWDNQAQLFYTKNGQLFSKTTRIVNGEWNNLEFLGERRLLNNEDGYIENFSLLGLYGNIVIGSYTTDNDQKMFVYEY